MIGKKFPDSPPVKRFVRGHLYLVQFIHDLKVQSVLVFKKVLFRHGFYSHAYKFYRLASTIDRCSWAIIARPRLWYVKELDFKDLPLYIPWHTTTAFKDALNHGQEFNKVKLHHKSKNKIALEKSKENGRSKLFKRLSGTRPLVISFRRKSR
jgi:hypothetical protein